MWNCRSTVSSFHTTSPTPPLVSSDQYHLVLVPAAGGTQRQLQFQPDRSLLTTSSAASRFLTPLRNNAFTNARHLELPAVSFCPIHAIKSCAGQRSDRNLLLEMCFWCNLPEKYQFSRVVQTRHVKRRKEWLLSRQAKTFPWLFVLEMPMQTARCQSLRW